MRRPSPLRPGRIRSAVIAACRSDPAPGLLLIVMACTAMVAANSGAAGFYDVLFHAPLPGPAPLPDLQAWINEGLMAVFFFATGLEIKREALIGDLASPATRRLPMLCAGAGMIAPALIYLACIRGHGGLAAGWAIPASTDIAFAVGVLGLVASRLPPSLRLFLLSVAVIDDLGAVTIIALFYHAQTAAIWLGASAAVLAVMLALNLGGYRRGVPYLVLAGLLWVCVLYSGIHPSIAGVAAATAIPLRTAGVAGDEQPDSLLLRWEHALVPWCAWAILPLFALANAGVAPGGAGGAADGGWLGALLQPLPLAVGAGLVVGKQVGILGAAALAERLGIARRPDGAGWTQLWGIGALAGIGFTMSLFIAALAFPADAQWAQSAKLGVLAGSLLSAVAGYLILRLGAAEA